jgi:mannose-6-phosphate isomerase-like protein (cupin superfamily)
MRAPRRKTLWVAAGLLALTLAGLPGVQSRAALIKGKLTGDAGLPWAQLIVQLAPWRWQPAVRRWVGPPAEAWARPLSGLAQSAGENGRVLLFEGETPTLAKLNCHYSILASGASPHPPHEHVDEEIVLPLRGEVEIVRGDTAEVIGPGQLAFHASNLPHTIRGAGTEPSEYLIMRWNARAARPEAGLPAQTFDLEAGWDALALKPGPVAKQVVLDGPTTLLDKLHFHLTRLDRGALSPEHVDEHDVLMLTIDGEIETAGERVEPESLVFHPAGAPHSIRNVGEGPARYLVIELSGRGEN